MEYINHNDWKIHRKLDKTRTVYLHSARGQGGIIYQIMDLLSQNKIVAVVYNDQTLYYHPDNFQSLIRWFQDFTKQS